MRQSQIRDANAKISAQRLHGLTCVFAGATSGIGEGTLTSLINLSRNSIFYVIGRCEARFDSQRHRLQSLGPSNRIVFLEAQISCLESVDAASLRILNAEKKLDYLYMSPGAIPLNGPECLSLRFALLNRQRRRANSVYRYERRA
jgi:NAD(P)-dependent dehydrogenase (short-subunit alcohol dehydrogenase family)